MKFLYFFRRKIHFLTFDQLIEHLIDSRNSKHKWAHVLTIYKVDYEIIQTKQKQLT